MKLSPDDVALFYRLMWPLQFYVNQRLGILEQVDSVEMYAAIDRADKLLVRDALYENIDLIDRFVADNPAHLSDNELAIVRSWKRLVAGDFFIERFLKRGAIFILSSDSPRPLVYSVLGLAESVRDALPEFLRPPMMTKAVLLPFKGRIIYDGLLQTYSIHFGSGMRDAMKEYYMAAKQNGLIIESLDPQLQAQAEKRARKPARDWRPEIKALVQSASQLKGGGTPVQGEAFALLKASARLTQAVVQNPDDLDALWKAEERVARALSRLEKALVRADV